MQKAVIAATVLDVDDAGCDHGCTQVVRLVNVLDETVWEMCVVSFEMHVGRTLKLIDCRAKGSSHRCIDCPHI